MFDKRKWEAKYRKPYYEAHKKDFFFRNKRRMRRLRKKAINYLGGRCSKCGYNKCVAALDAHHINPETKENEINSLITRQRKWVVIKKELDKCILLCANCHREEHYNESAKKNVGMTEPG